MSFDNNSLKVKLVTFDSKEFASISAAVHLFLSLSTLFIKNQADFFAIVSDGVVQKQYKLMSFALKPLSIFTSSSQLPFFEVFVGSYVLL